MASQGPVDRMLVISLVCKILQAILGAFAKHGLCDGLYWACWAAIHRMRLGCSHRRHLQLYNGTDMHRQSSKPLIQYIVRLAAFQGPTRAMRRSQRTNDTTLILFRMPRAEPK